MDIISADKSILPELAQKSAAIAKKSCEWNSQSRGGVWQCKNHKYFKKRKLDIEFQIFLLFYIFFASKNSL